MGPEDLQEVHDHQWLERMISALEKIVASAQWYNQIKEVNRTAAQVTLVNLHQLVEQATLLTTAYTKDKRSPAGGKKFTPVNKISCRECGLGGPAGN